MSWAHLKESLLNMLLVYDEPKWKLEIVVQYFWKYVGKPSVRTRRSNGSVDDTTFSGALKCFSDITGTKSAVKRIVTEVIQLLLVHGFQVIGLALYELIYIPVNK
ncbi:negative regulator of systemic acquired resistance SNI1-like [Humulus lupulus]|uniref:negative regulator of systemic acquired resistance SNI1-like n=1 Tax=Humulus lupulus TaxID=3486 RepID=UPI002B417964|nr:negative regulator of systemic acquired resistance SNI1-like [Humulus lupulus]